MHISLNSFQYLFNCERSLSGYEMLTAPCESFELTNRETEKLVMSF